jgi:hypothetical protein
MANISTYPLATPKATDLVLGTQTNALGTNHTKSFTVGSIADKVSSIQLGYTSLVQLLNQTGTAAPIATEVYNNTGQTFTWSYVSQGVYRITSTGTPFTVNKTVVFTNLGSHNTTTLRDIGWNRISDSIIEIETATLNDTITNGSFEVKIYN